MASGQLAAIREMKKMGKEPATHEDMRSTVFDYQWREVGPERGGPVPGIKEKLLASDPVHVNPHL
jgi:hypothetical protein